MNSHLPDYRSKESRVLYIIGNGFDLYHKLPTKYEDFHQWLLENHPRFEHNMNHIYGDENHELWSNFEEALGKNKSLYELHDYFGDKSLPRKEQQTHAAIEIKKTLDNIRPYLEEWAKTIEYECVRPVLPLGKGSKYVTFNYTRTLEEVYGIDGEDTVLHIHGMIGQSNIETGFRYGNDDFPIGSSLEEISQENIKHELERMKKPTAKIFERCQDFFKDLNQIRNVIVIGHSLSEIDLPYIKYLLLYLPSYPPIKYYYWVHTEKAESEAAELIKELCYQNSDIEGKMSKELWEYHIMDEYRYKNKNIYNKHN